MSDRIRAVLACVGLACLLAASLGSIGCDDFEQPDDNAGGDPGGDAYTCPDDDAWCQLEEGGFEEPEFLPFSTTNDFLTIKQDGAYRPVFIKAVNLGVGTPHTRAGHLAASKQDYRRWFEQMSDMGLNTLRIYTLHYPRFYEALAEHNERHADRPLYILHGVWLFEEFRGMHYLGDSLRTNIRQIVDCVHGNCHIEHRLGKAFGTYRTNVSKWVLGWIVGREVEPQEVAATNEHLSDKTSFEGQHFRAVDVQPFEAWWAEQLEFLVDYEIDNYDQTRPVSVSTWPTLDPLEHEVEGAKFSREDVESFDISLIESVDAPGGIFATYHAYPYFPDFIVNDPDFREHSDDVGPNAYLGYLTHLRAHHSDIPLFIGETGVSSSWGSAHWGHRRAMNHGGHTEVEQGAVAGRLFRNVLAADTAGAALFAWLDEWWKPTWITDPRGSPDDRRPYWHNVMAPEQNFGMIAFDPGPPPFEDGQVHDGRGLVEKLTIVHDVAFLHLRVETSAPLGDDELVVAFDTYGAADSPEFSEELGESVLPNGVETNRRNEFALIIEGSERAELMVTHAYDTFRIWQGTAAEGTLHRSTETDGEDWNLVTWLNSAETGSDDGEYVFDETVHKVGKLRVRAADEAATSHDAVVVGDGRIDIRIPWTLLNVTDPSMLEVLHNDPETDDYERATTAGIAVGVAHGEQLLLETDRYSWQRWGMSGDITDVPPFNERPKPALDVFDQALDGLPDWMD
jgi:hypothetical protein